ncbi:SHOCT domain-containing protein [Halorussus halophilus]|uniref:SHOCT domain-containing protein n=1 Tax=Halorussus halophilus TaxID=2650975 RepID=UPI0013010E24|nr:SHOCT domain-containing protein [Halorussus halophilus]
MPRSPSQSLGWHDRIEQYTPDGALGRTLFGVVFGLGLGSFLFFAGIVQVTGPVSPLFLSELVGLASVPVGSALLAISLVVLWPVYLSLIGNLESVKEYEVGRSERVSSDARVRRDEDDPEEILKRRYAAGELSQHEFERRLDGVLGVDSGQGRETQVEHEIE